MTPNTDSKDASKELYDLLDRYFREVAVDGLHNGGFNTKSQRRIDKAVEQINSLMISRKEVEEALSELLPPDSVDTICYGLTIKRIRTKLNLKPLQEKS